VAYLDASVLVALITPEPSSLAVQRWLNAARSDRLVVSDWSMTESASALGMKVRLREMPASELPEAWELLSSMVSASFEPLSPRRIDFERAIEFLAQPALGLRAGDALHLAVAVGAEAGPVVTLDKTMLRAARRLGIEAVNPNG
jgi:predicted nucleic acid-binding protein